MSQYINQIMTTSNAHTQITHIQLHITSLEFRLEEKCKLFIHHALSSLFFSSLNFLQLHIAVNIHIIG